MFCCFFLKKSWKMSGAWGVGWCIIHLLPSFS
jgi:hypothetical protein